MGTNLNQDIFFWVPAISSNVTAMAALFWQHMPQMGMLVLAMGVVDSRPQMCYFLNYAALVYMGRARLDISVA